MCVLPVTSKSLLICVCPATVKTLFKLVAPVTFNWPPTFAVFATIRPVPEPKAINTPPMLAWPEFVKPNIEFEKYT